MKSFKQTVLALTLVPLAACSILTGNLDESVSRNANPLQLQGGIPVTIGALPLPTSEATMSQVVVSVTPTASPESTVVPGTPPTPTLTPTPNPYPWTDETPTMYGICFEAAQDAANQVFVLRSAEDHIRFYDLADNSQLCSRPVKRNPFDFIGGQRVLAGMWSVGTGCTARHDVIDYSVEERVLSIDVRFVTEGDCNYELVRPYWVGVAGVDDVKIQVVQ